jgi:hypothetical protein
LSAATALAAAARTDREDEGNWVTLQVRADPEVIRETLDNVSAVVPRVPRP